MTIAELGRLIDSKKRIHKQELREKAQFDYILADAIGRSIGRIYSGAFPDISSIYPSLFTNDEIKEAQAENKMELSVIRFKQFAERYNSRFKEANSIDE